MLFASYEFIAFLAILFVLYYLLPRLTRGKCPALQWVLLLVFSYAFYLFAGVQYLFFLLFTTVSSYFVGRLMGRHAEKEDRAIENAAEPLSREARKELRAKGKKRRRMILCVGLILNFGMLAVLKYTAFLFTSVNLTLHTFGFQGSLPVPSLLLPMGISFYTFQTMGYLIDVYRKKATPEYSLPRFMLFASFFPQLVQGPISRHSDLSRQLYEPHSFSAESFGAGLLRVLYGYCKKLIIADRVLIAIKTILGEPEQYTGLYVLLMILLYSVQIYADFTGGIDITIGVSEMLGIRLKENFKKPFSSRSTEEYWKRWHITMGTWFQDYIFYPLAVSGPMLRLSKWSKNCFGTAVSRRLPVYICTVVTWFLTGLWHGAGWNFIVWGLLNCAVLLISQELKPVYDRFHKRFPRLTASRPYGIFMKVRTFLLMGTIRILDCYRSVPLTFALVGTIFYAPKCAAFFSGGLLELGLSLFDYAVLAFGVLIMYVVSRFQTENETDTTLRVRIFRRPVLSSVLIGVMVLLILMLGIYGPGYDASQFIYNQF